MSRLLLVASFWSFHLAACFSFAADFEDKYSHTEGTPGNIYSILGLLFFGGLLALSTGFDS